MGNAAHFVVLALATALLALPGQTGAQPQEIRATLPLATLAGQARFTFWGFQVYDASLWVQPGFTAAAYERHAFALELSYLRDFTNEAIAKRSIDEMRRLPGSTEAQLMAWLPLLREAFPDISKGDRIIGIHRPGEGVVFITNGKTTGAILDAEFGRQFFGIWLSVRTSEPRLRGALLGRAAPP